MPILLKISKKKLKAREPFQTHSTRLALLRYQNQRQNNNKKLQTTIPAEHDVQSNFNRILANPIQ